MGAARERRPRARGARARATRPPSPTCSRSTTGAARCGKARGGAIGEGAARFFRPGALAAAPAGQLGAAPTPAALVELAKLSGLLRLVVTAEAGSSWSVGFKLGPGAIPAQATTTILIAEADAAALGRGELDPMTAFLSGKMRVEGDMTLMLQVQAVQMQAAAASAPKTS